MVARPVAGLLLALGLPLASLAVEPLPDVSTLASFEISSAVPDGREAASASLAVGMFYGIFIGLVLYNLFLLTSVRQAIYGHLTGHTLSLGLIFACFDGLAFQRWPAATGWYSSTVLALVTLLNIFTVLFVRRFVDSRRVYPRLDRLLRGAPWALLASGGLAAFWGAGALLWLTSLWLVFLGAVLAITVIRHARRHQPARIYALAWGLLWLALAAATAERMGWVGHGFTTLPVLRLVALAEVLLAAMAVAVSLGETRRALAASEEKLSRAFQASPDAITITTLAEGRFLEVNDSFEKVSGHSKEEALGRTSRELGIWEQDGRERLMTALRKHGRVKELEGQIIRKSGRRCPIRFSAAPIEVEGEPCMVAVVHDMTQLKQATEQRERLIGRLEAQNAELERFAYTVSHDLKAPLISIGGFLGFLEKEIPKASHDKAGHYIKRIRSASRRMYQLLDELLDLSRIGRVANPVEQVPLGELALEAGEQLAEHLRRKNIDLEVASDLPVVRGDRTRLLEVFQNLLENAARFVGDQPPRIEIGCRREGEETACYVRDNGIGIEPRFHDKVFGLFERLDAETEGTGVGLALVKRIIESHGGRIWIESSGKGAGTTFWFVIPEA